MEDDDDEFGLTNTGDLDVDHDDELGAHPRRTPARSGNDSLFSGDDDDGLDSGPPARSLPPSASRPSGGGQENSDGDLFGDGSGADGDEGFGLSEREDFGRAPPPTRPPPARRRDIDSGAGANDSAGDSFGLDGDSGLGLSNGDDFGAAPPATRRQPTPPPARGHGRGSEGSGGSLFGDESGADGFGATADRTDDFGEDPLPRSAPRPQTGADFTDPSLSLDANDSAIADLLGPQGQGSSRHGPPLPPPQVVSAPPPPPPDRDEGGFGLGEEDSELAELLGEKRGSGSGTGAAPLPPLPPMRAPSPSQPPAPSRRISFQEPVAQPAYRSARSPSPHADDFGEVEDSGEGYGLAADADQEVARIAGQRGGRGLGPADGSVRSGSAFGEGLYDDEGPASGYSRRPQPYGGQLGGRGGDEFGEDGEEDDYGDDDGFGDDEPGARGGAGGRGFQRVPPRDDRGTPPLTGRRHQPVQASGETYDDDYYDDDEEDVFADDVSWDGEIRASHVMSRQGGGGGGVRPGSAGHPRSRGPHATGGRRRPQSAMAPRERQAALLEDMQSRHPSTWDIREVAAWLEFIGMGQYRSKFVHHSVDGSLLLSLGESELARDLRILPLGHRRALMGAIEALRSQAEEMEKAGQPGVKQAKTEAERVAELRRRAEDMGGQRRPSSAGAHVIPPEPFLGPAQGKITVYEQRAKLLHQLDKARHRAAQHAAIIDQLAGNKAVTEAQMAQLRGKLKDLETKHKDEFGPPHRPGMTAPLTSAGGPTGPIKTSAAYAAAEYGADAAVPWLPVGRGTRAANPHPERYVPSAVDPDVELTFQPKVLKESDVPSGPVRDIVAKALASRTPFWQRMDFEFEKMRKEREAKEEARRKRRERMGVVKRGGGEGEDDEKAKSPHWNNFWVPGSQKNASYHKHFKRGSENADLNLYRSFTKDKGRLSRWFKKFVDDDENTEGDVALERLINRMIKALVKTKAQMDEEFGDNFDSRIRNYFEERGYRFATHVSQMAMVRARGTRAPGPPPPDTTPYDFEEVEQYYPDYLKKKVQAAGDDYGDEDDEQATRMVPKRTTWKRLIQIYYMDRQSKIKAAIAMVKMSQFVQRHGAKFPPERDRETGKKDAWVPSSRGGALHQPDGRDRTFNTIGQENISMAVKLKKSLGPEPPKTYQMRMKEQEERETKAEDMLLLMGWPKSSEEFDEPRQQQQQQHTRRRTDPEEMMGNEILPNEGEDGGGGFGLDGVLGEGGGGGDGGGLEPDAVDGDNGFGMLDGGGNPDGGGGRGLGEGGWGPGGGDGAQVGGDGGGGREGEGGPGEHFMEQEQSLGQRSAPPMNFFGALNALLDRALQLREMNDEWLEAWRRAEERGYGQEELPLDPPSSEDLDWSGDPLMQMQEAAMDRQHQEAMQLWERRHQQWERKAARMQQQGYHQEDIEHKLGPEPLAEEYAARVRNHLLRNVDLLSRMKRQYLLRFRNELKGTKQKMAVYRALCSQMFLDETSEKQRAREETVRRIYETYQRPGPRPITREERQDLIRRMQEDLEARQQRKQELLAQKLAEEESNLIPWNRTARPPSRGPSQTPSRDISPRDGRKPPGGPPPNSSPPKRTRPPKGSPSWDKYVFGSSTPKSMWAPMGPVRNADSYRPLHTRGRQGGTGGSLLDSPAAREMREFGGLEGAGHSTASLGPSPHQRAGGRTPNRSRPTTPTRSSRPASAGRAPPRPATADATLLGADGASAQARRRPASPGPAGARPRTAGGNDTGAGAGTPPGRGAPARASAPARPGASGTSPAAPRRPSSAAPPASPGRPGRPASPARTPGPGPATSPRGVPGRAGSRPAPQSAARSSGGGGGGTGWGSARSSAAGPPPRRGLMDGDTTSGPSASPSPVRGQTGGATARVRTGRGLADSDSSPSPPPARRAQLSAQPPATPPPPQPTRGPGGGGGGPSAAGPGSQAGGQASRRSSQASGVGGAVGPGGMRTSGTGSTAGSRGGGAGSAAAPPSQRPLSGASTPPPAVSRQASAASGIGMAPGAGPGMGAAPQRQPSGASTPQRGLSQQGSAASGLGLAGPGAGAGGTAQRRSSAAQGGLSQQGSAASGLGLPAGGGRASGSGSGGAGSRRPSTTPAPLEQQASVGSGGSGGSGGAGTTGSGGAGRAGAGMVPGGSQRSPLSRSPVSASPPQSPPPQSQPQDDDLGDGDGDGYTDEGYEDDAPVGAAEDELQAVEFDAEGAELELDEGQLDGAELALDDEGDEEGF